MLKALLLLISASTVYAAEYTVYTTDLALTFHGEHRPWCDASQACVFQGRRLVIIDSEQMNIATDAVVPGTWNAWIGATDVFDDHTFVWIDGRRVDSLYSNWLIGEPSHYSYSGKEDCLEIGQAQSDAWNDVICGYSQPFVCQLELTRETSAHYTVLTLSDAMPGSNPRTSFWNAQKECESKGMRIARADSREAFEVMQRKLSRDSEAKYWFETNNGKCASISVGDFDIHDCTNTALPYICEVVTPWAVKISNFTPQLHETENLELDCTAKGFPLPDVAWYKDDELITDKIDQRIHQSIGSATSTLVISNSQLDDAGQYRCYATNAAINHEKRVFGLALVEVHPTGAKIETKAKKRDISELYEK